MEIGQALLPVLHRENGVGRDVLPDIIRGSGGGVGIRVDVGIGERVEDRGEYDESQPRHPTPVQEVAARAEGSEPGQALVGEACCHDCEEGRDREQVAEELHLGEAGYEEEGEEPCE